MRYKERFSMTPYERGGLAYSEGKSLDENPYEYGYDVMSTDWHEWRRGWVELGRGGV